MDVSRQIINETMRIGGKKVDGPDGSIDVMNPYTNEVVGTIPRASREQVRKAFDIAAAYTPTLTRYERQ